MQPYLKWAGGKSQLLPLLQYCMPEKFNNYLEPFVGGGSVFWSLGKPGITIGDINPDLMSVYRVLKSAPDELIVNLEAHKERHCIDPDHYYYEVRDIDPETLGVVQRAGRFIYLIRTCFNGLSRYNSRGKFNTPKGKYTNPKICDPLKIIEAHKYLVQNEVMIFHQSWAQTVEMAEEGDLVYIDPPYYAEKPSFNYYDSVFRTTELLPIIKNLVRRGVFVLVSNSDTEYTRELFKDYSIFTAVRSGRINSKGSGRQDVSEIIVRCW